MADNWRDEYDALPASIGGAPFHVEAAKTTIGRRTVVQKFPGTDFVRVQDLGPEADTFDVIGYVIGSDYHQKRSALEAVFRRPGPYLLVHPYRGRMLVGVEGGLNIDEDKGKGGFARISFRCIKHSDQPQSSVDPTTSVRNTVAAARNTVRPAMANRIDGLADSSVRTPFLARVDAVTTTITGSVNAALYAAEVAVGTAVSDVTALTSDVSAVISTPTAIVDAISQAVSTIVMAPFNAEATLEGTVATLTDGERHVAMLGIVRRLARSEYESGMEDLTPGCLADIPGDNESVTTRVLRNDQAITAAVRAEVAATMCEAILRANPESRTQAQEALEVLGMIFAGESDGNPDALLYAVDADSYAALSDLRSATTKYLRERSVDLPDIQTYTPPGETNALLLAEKLLGDATRWHELAERNGWVDPLFVPAGEPVEYLAA